ncbi:MAG TPA: radical SAM protein [Bacillota bacterium]|nr:radical SAM protein [Bacillota bacterium]
MNLKSLCLNILGREQRLLEKSLERNFPFLKPSKMSIMVTSKCNSRCIYCDSWKMERASAPSAVNGPTVEDINRLCAAAKKLGVQEVSLSGGEPLLRSDLEELITLLSQEFKVLVTTNGMLLSEERVARLAKSGLKNLILSLDSLDAETYQQLRGIPFQHAEGALESLLYGKKNHPQLEIGVNCVVNRYNIGSLEEFSRKFFKKIPKVGRISFLAYDRVRNGNHELLPTEEQYPVLRSDIAKLIAMKKEGFWIMNSEENLNAIPDYLYGKKTGEETRCGAGFFSVNIGDRMTLHPCLQLPAIADLKVENLTEVWFSGKMKAQREKMLKGQCPGCSCVFNKHNPFQVTISQIVKHFLLNR